MSRLPDTTLTVNLARDVVEQVAPDESASFSTLSTAYTKNPRSIRRQQAMKGDDVGFGVGATQVLAPIILVIAEQVLAKLSSDTLERGTSTLFRRLREKIFRRSSPEKRSDQAALPEYPPADIEVYAYKAARAFVSEATANQIAQVLVASLKARKEEIEGLQARKPE